MTADWIEETRQAGTLVLEARGRWIASEAGAIDRRLSSVKVGVAAGGAPRVRIDLARLDALDTTGAWLLLRLQRNLAKAGAEASLDNPPPDFAPLLRQLQKQKIDGPPPPIPSPPWPILLLNYVGAGTVAFLAMAQGQLGFFGLVVVTALNTLRHRSRIRFIPLVAQMQKTGVSALGIVGLLSFLIGVVMAYQGATQLTRFGAQIYTVNLLGISFLRELGVLMTAIIIAGRSGSAFTAEIGAMVVNEEIDAIRTIGLDPIELLVLPRVLALILCLPLLAFYANVMGLLGGAVICWSDLGIPFPLFAEQLRGSVSLWSFWLGIIKAPFFGATIALIGCNEGFSVERNAESVGRHTTLSVVQSIFLVIVIDAAFSVLFSFLRI
jgi:phospholipid/cholesterol/gamma-HCH transport system permease protein